MAHTFKCTAAVARTGVAVDVLSVIMSERSPLNAGDRTANKDDGVILNSMEMPVYVELYRIVDTPSDTGSSTLVPHDCSKATGRFLDHVGSSVVSPNNTFSFVETPTTRGSTYHVSFYCLFLPGLYSDVVVECPIRTGKVYSITQEGGGTVSSELLSMRLPKPTISGGCDV